eukprot:XP_011670295.1 PREDICTED: proteoglycan 4 isoform X1 [Strongylocentrotus purpuratus]
MFVDLDVRAMAILWLNFNFKWRTRISEHKKHGVHNSYSPTRINRLLRLLNMYIWIAILFCCVHLGAAQTSMTTSANMTSNENMTTVELTTIADVTELLDFTTDLTTESSGGDLPGWIYGAVAAGAVVLIVIIIIIIICVKKRCRCRRTPPTPVDKNVPLSDYGQERDKTYNGGYTDDNQGDIHTAIEMGPRASGIEDEIYQNTAFPSQVNPAFDHSQPAHHLDDDFPSMPPPAPPRGASSNIDMDTRPALVIPSPRSPYLPSPGPMPLASPLDDIPDRLPPAVPTPGLKDIRAELNDKFKDVAPPDKKTKKKKEKKKDKKEDKPKAPQREIDPNEQVRGEVPMQPTHNLDSARPKPNIIPRFDFADYPPKQNDVADFGENYEEMSPRQQEERDFGGEYEDMGGDGSEDYDDEYEDVDPNAKPVKPVGTKQAIPMPYNLHGQRGVANLNQRPMVPPPETAEDYGGDYEVVVSPNEEPKRRLPGRNIDNRQRVSIPSQDEDQDHGGLYEDVANPTVSPKRKPLVPKPKTPKKSPKPPPGDDFGQEYGNTGNRTMFPATTTQRRPPTLPSSSNWHQEEEEDDDWLPPPPPPPPGLDQGSPVQSPDQDYGAEYDNIGIKPTIKKKPPVPKPKVAKKPSNSGGSSTLPMNPKQQLSPFEARSSATLPVPGGHELIEEGEEDSFYENLEGLKGKLSMHYQNLPTAEKPQEQISSSGYSIFSERPK